MLGIIYHIVHIYRIRKFYMLKIVFSHSLQHSSLWHGRYNLMIFKHAINKQG